MCAVPPLPRESARVSNVAVKLHRTPMPTRRHKPPARFRKPTNRLPSNLRRLELKCGCKLTMRPCCCVGKVPGCRIRRKTKRCECKVALLPVCLVAEGIGCEDRQLGKKCRCAQAMLPMCYNLGCKDKKDGHNCHCPRTPGEICKHVCKLIMHYRKLTVEEIASLVRWWIERLKDADFDNYREPELPAPDVAMTQEARIKLREDRLNMGIGLWHREDVLTPVVGREEEIQRRRYVDFARVLQKGGAA